MKRKVRLALFFAAVCSLTFTGVSRAEDQLEPDLAADAQKSAGDPPVIPHAVKPDQDGEACNACHRDGLKNAPPTSHPERLNCTSCHVQGAVKKQKRGARQGGRR